MLAPKRSVHNTEQTISNTDSHRTKRLDAIRSALAIALTDEPLPFARILQQVKRFMLPHFTEGQDLDIERELKEILFSNHTVLFSRDTTSHH